MSSNQLKAAATGAKAPATIQGLLTDPKFKAQMALAMPKHMTADRLARIALTEIRKTPALAQCNQASFLGAIMQCAQLGLELGGALGHAYLLPYGQTATFILGYRGMIDLARRSGQMVSLTANVVYENDDFKYQLGLHPDVHHIPAETERGAMTHVYAVANLKGGGVQFEVMSKYDVDKIRAGSKAGKSGPWVSYYEEMAKKTVIRRLFKYLPVSIEMSRAVGLDEQADAGVAQDNPMIIDAEDFVNADTGEVTQAAPQADEAVDDEFLAQMAAAESQTN
jgi:recombination protein RecT